MLFAWVLTGPAVLGQVPITVPNNSFENPTTTFATFGITSWPELPQPAGFVPMGFTWADEDGVFANTIPSSPDHIDNLDGTQSGYIFADQNVGIYQLLSSTYQVGNSYQLTVGIVGQGGGILDGQTLEVELYYPGTNGSMVVIAETTAIENSANFPSHTHEFDFPVGIQTVQPTDLWANQPIGIELFAPQTAVDSTGAPLSGGYWDVDNVRLTSVPEPGSLALLCCGGFGLLRRRPRRIS